MKAQTTGFVARLLRDIRDVALLAERSSQSANAARQQENSKVFARTAERSSMSVNAAEKEILWQRI